MKPGEGARKQIEIYRCMSGQERLKIAFEMWEMAKAIREHIGAKAFRRHKKKEYLTKLISRSDKAEN